MEHKLKARVGRSTLRSFNPKNLKEDATFLENRDFKLLTQCDSRLNINPDEISNIFGDSGFAKHNVPVIQSTLKQDLIRKLNNNLPSLSQFNHRISLGIKKQELSELELRAKNYLFKYKIVNDPMITFSLVNIIIQERERILNQKKQKQQATVSRPIRDKKMSSKHQNQQPTEKSTKSEKAITPTYLQSSMSKQTPLNAYNKTNTLNSTALFNSTSNLNIEDKSLNASTILPKQPSYLNTTKQTLHTNLNIPSNNNNTSINYGIQSSMNNSMSFNSSKTLMKNPSTEFLPSIEPRNLKLHQSREEVLGLARWLDAQLANLKSKKQIQVSDLLDYKQSVLNLGLGQIIRMVSNTCKERGKLLKLIWDSTFDTFEQLLNVLSLHSSNLEEQHLKQIQQRQNIFAEQLAHKKIQHDQLNQEYQAVLEKFKSLIISNRRLKREKKNLDLMHKMQSYRLEAYQQGYAVALEMALQSSDNNITDWAKRVMSKLIRDKRQKKKNFLKAQVDAEQYKEAKQVVFNWLRRTVANFDPNQFKKYDNFDPMEQFKIEKLNRTNHKRQHSHNTNPAEATQETTKQVSQSGEHPVGFHQTRQVSGKSLNSDTRQMESNQTFQDQQNQETSEISSQAGEGEKVDVYEYFKCHDVGTCTQIVCVDAETECVPMGTSVAVQTFKKKTVDQEVEADIPIQRFNDSNVAQMPDKNGANNEPSINDSFSQSDNGDSSARKKRRVGRLDGLGSQSSINQLIIDTKVKNTVRKNLVMISTKRNKRQSHLSSKFIGDVGMKRLKSTFSADEESFMPAEKAMDRSLQLRKFEQIFQQEKNYMMNNLSDFIRKIQRRRSFFRARQVEYCTSTGFERNNMQKKIKIRNIQYNLGGFADYSKVAKKLKNMIDNTASTLMKHRTYKQNQQIFTNISTDLKEARVRDQKIVSTISTLSKVLSTLVVDYVRLTKKEKEEQRVQTDKFFYPLNVLFVDRFMHTYGLKDIAEKNLKNTLGHILCLSERSEKVCLFKILLGLTDKSVSGDQLQIYVRCLVYFDSSGKISLNQTAMKDFSIDRLMTDRSVIMDNISKVCEGFLTHGEIQELKYYLSQEEGEPTIEGVCIRIIEAHIEKKAKFISEYLPLYGYLQHQNEFIVNLLQMIKSLRFSMEREVETMKGFMINLDVIEENFRNMTAQRFVSTCLRVGLPTISEMSEHYLKGMRELGVSSDFISKYGEWNESSMNYIAEFKKQWHVRVPQNITQELTTVATTNNSKLLRFWWLMALHRVVSQHSDSMVNSVLGSLADIGLETYPSLFKKASQITK